MAAVSAMTAFGAATPAQARCVQVGNQLRCTADPPPRVMVRPVQPMPGMVVRPAPGVMVQPRVYVPPQYVQPRVGSPQYVQPRVGSPQYYRPAPGAVAKLPPSNPFATATTVPPKSGPNPFITKPTHPNGNTQNANLAPKGGNNNTQTKGNGGNNTQNGGNNTTQATNSTQNGKGGNGGKSQNGNQNGDQQNANSANQQNANSQGQAGATAVSGLPCDQLQAQIVALQNAQQQAMQTCTAISAGPGCTDPQTRNLIQQTQFAIQQNQALLGSCPISTASLNGDASTSPPAPQLVADAGPAPVPSRTVADPGAEQVPIATAANGAGTAPATAASGADTAGDPPNPSAGNAGNGNAPTADGGAAAPPVAVASPPPLSPDNAAPDPSIDNNVAMLPDAATTANPASSALPAQYIADIKSAAAKFADLEQEAVRNGIDAGTAERNLAAALVSGATDIGLDKTVPANGDSMQDSMNALLHTAHDVFSTPPTLSGTMDRIHALFDGMTGSVKENMDQFQKMYKQISTKADAT